MSPAHTKQNTSFSSARQAAIGAHRANAGGFRTSRMLSDAVDGLLSGNLARTDPAIVRPYAFVALGGYGRRELCFASDVDIMILTPAPAADPSHAGALKDIVHSLMDLPVDLGHSTRSIAESLALAESDFDAWISLLDARFIFGHEGLYRTFVATLNSSIRTIDKPDVVRHMTELSRTRHEKHGRSTKLLEPNIKNSSGGLRDLHSVLWILRVLGKVPVGHSGADPALRAMFRSTALRALFPPAFLRTAQSSADKLIHVRNEMHLISGTLHDSLEFSAQSSIAEALGYRTAGRTTSVERFMRDYYDAANSVAELHSRVMLWAQDLWTPPPTHERPRSAHGDLRIASGRIRLRARSRLTTELLLRAFLLRAETQSEFSYALEDAIHRSLVRFRTIRKGAAAGLLRQLFARTGRTASSLRLMSRLGVLERWIPEWRPLVRFFQHNQYHFYTADEHTLRAIEHAESLENNTSPFGIAYRSLSRHDTLYFAILFHDITKPDRLEDHEISGGRLSRSVLRRLGADELADDVAYLVRRHLSMEQVAFRRNLADPSTIADFAATFPRPELLDYLFVLTYADLSAVNVNVLTDWKKSLLTELYQKTASVLRPEIRAPRGDTLRADLERAIPAGDLAPHASLLSDEAYLRAFSRDEIAQHLRILRRMSTVGTSVQHWSDVTEMTLFARDAPFVLARSCGVLYANDLNIIDAQIFTREDGFVIDKFRVVDQLTNAPLTEERCRSVQADLEAVFTSAATVENLLERHRRRWKRRQLHVNPNARTDVAFESHPSFTIVDVFGVDVPGFLYHVTDTLSGVGCSIHSAKIATRGDGIVDAFYVRETDGSRVDDPERRRVIRQSILERLRSLYDSHFVPEHVR